MIENTIEGALLTGTDAADTISNNEADNVTINALGGDDLVMVINSSNVLVNSGGGDDTIITNGKNSTITGGIGNNLISLTSAEVGTAEGIVIALVEDELTTVEGFKGIGSGEADTLYFADGAMNKAIGFTKEGLSFWTDTVMGGSDYLKVTFPDIKDTTRIYLKYGNEDTIVEAFVSKNSVYNASLGIADIYVGASAVNFDGIDSEITVDLASVMNGDKIIGNSKTTFIIGEDTLKPVDETSKVTISRPEEGAMTVSGIGNWALNDSTVTLGVLTSLKGGATPLAKIPHRGSRISCLLTIRTQRYTTPPRSKTL